MIKGYAVMLLSYTVDSSALKTAAMAPDSILVDEAFRYVYNDDTIDFDHLDRFDFVKMSKALVAATNARVKSDVVVANEPIPSVSKKFVTKPTPIAIAAAIGLESSALCRGSTRTRATINISATRARPM